MNSPQKVFNPRKYTLLFTFCMIAISLTIWGCAAAIVDNSKVTYENESFTRTKLFEGGLAVMPVTAGRGVEGYRRPFGVALNNHIVDYKPKEINFKTLEWEESMDQLNRAGLTQKYNDAILAYKETAIIDLNLLKELGETFGVRYLLFTELGDFSDESNYAYDWFSGSGYSTRKVGMFAYCNLWDCEEGDIVWECVGDISATSSKYTYVAEEDTEKFSSMAAESIITRLYNVPKKTTK